MIKVLSTGVMLAIGGQAFAQDIHFSQFYENSILRNPALTGIFSGDFKAGVNYRSQWASVATPYNTVAATAEARFVMNRAVGDYLSVGLGAYYDKAGSIGFASTSIFPSVAYNKALNDKHNTYLSVGFTAGYISRSVDMSKMTFSSQVIGGVYSGSNASGENAPFNSLSAFDLGAGISLNSSLDLENRVNYYLGAALYHINRPTQIFNGGYSTVKLPMKWQFNAGVNIVMSDHFSLAMHGNYSTQKPYTESMLGGLITYHALTPGVPSIFAFGFGAFYRADDAFIPTVKLDYQSVSVGVSYDVNNSKLGSLSGGASATEITLYIRSKFAHKTNPMDGIMCPRFESEVYQPFQ